MSTATSPVIDRQEVRRALGLMLDQAGAYEVRYCPAKGATAGLDAAESIAISKADIDHAVDMIQALAIRRRRGSLYVTLNPAEGRPAFNDEDVTRRRWLLIDVDPVKAEGQQDESATDPEHDQALAWTDEIAEHLTGLGWPEPLRVDSGNGGHLLYRLDLPNDAESKALLRGVLLALNARWPAVDRKVFNASRITKLPGTWARKGADTAERPHRLCRIVSVPGSVEVVPVELLQVLGRPPGDGAEAAPGARAGHGHEGLRFGSTAGQGRRQAYMERAIRDEALKVALAPAGERNDTLNIAAFRLGQLMPHGLDATQARAMLLQAAMRAGLGEREATDTIDRALIDGQGEPRPDPFPDDRGNGKAAPARGQAAAAGAGDKADEVQAGQRAEDDRPVITITTEIDVVADQVVELLAPDPRVFQRGRALVHVVQEPGRLRPARGATRPVGTPAIVPMTASNILDRSCRAARWCKLKPLKDGGYEAVPAVLPENVIKAVLDRRQWPTIRPLEGVVECPTLRPDGSVLDRPGWDEDTGLLFIPSQGFPRIPDRPTREDARQAAERLLDLVSDFPFKEKHRAAFLAGLLTPLARFAIDGPTPLFLFDANVPGAGKSMMADLIALVVAGRLMARSAYPEKDDEVRKLILSIALGGGRMLLFDNVPTGFSVGGAALDGALTAPSIQDRILGKSEMSGEVPWHCVLYATGNNLGLRGDALRRVVPCRLESPEVNPEERTEFKYPNLLEHVRQHRGEMVAAGLTILRAYVVAGRPEPEQKLPSMDFRAWAGLIRHAIFWAIGEDPCEGRKELKENDAETKALEGLVEGWAKLCEAACQSPGEDGRMRLTAAQALAALDLRSDEFPELRLILSDWSHDGKLPSTRIVGNRLNRVRGRVTKEGSIDFQTVRGNRFWYVKPQAKPQTAPGGSGGSGDSICSLRGRDSSYSPSVVVPGGSEPETPQPPQPPQSPATWSMTARGSTPPPPVTADEDGWEDVA